MLAEIKYRLKAIAMLVGLLAYAALFWWLTGRLIVDLAAYLKGVL